MDFNNHNLHFDHISHLKVLHINSEDKQNQLFNIDKDKNVSYINKDTDLKSIINKNENYYRDKTLIATISFCTFTYACTIKVFHVCGKYFQILYKFYNIK